MTSSNISSNTGPSSHDRSEIHDTSGHERYDVINRPEDNRGQAYQDSDTKRLIPRGYDPDLQQTPDEDDKETQPLTSAKVPQSDGEPGAGAIEKYPFILLNVIMILNSAATRIYQSLIDQYIYQHYSDQLLGNTSAKTASNPCVNGSSGYNSSVQDAVQTIQDKTSEMSLYLAVVNNAPAMLSCVLLGVLSPVLSRKVLLMIPEFGSLVKGVVTAAVIYWDLDLAWLYIGYGVEGLCGNWAGLLLGIFLYMSDITSRGAHRTYFMSFLEGGKGLVASTMYYATGQLLKSTGFTIPALMAAIFLLLGFCVIPLLPERRARLDDHHHANAVDFSPAGCCRRLALPFSKGQHPRVRKMILWALMSVLILLIAATGNSKIRNLYLMNLPFCWDSATIGWFFSAQEMTFNLFTMFGVPLLYRLLPGLWLAIVGTVSALITYVMFAVATSSLEIYMTIGLAVGFNAPFGLIRGELSRMLGPESQGSLFAAIAVFESFSFAAGTPTLSLYRWSLTFYSGLAFSVLAGLLCFVLVMLGIYQVLWLQYRRELQNKELIIKPYGTINS
ncbi:unnamed protein product [Lymnaea stagnalis]|uniref:Proton-coupled folate transporter n=1 Tax=Lymnaea stagnalis TaxID=6523 RepID=A0AAV2H6X2_LYMST